MDHSTAEHDFDFLPGHWRVQHRRLRERLAGNDEWQVFDGTSTAQAILGGQGVVDDNVLNLPAGAGHIRPCQRRSCARNFCSSPSSCSNRVRVRRSKERRGCRSGVPRVSPL